MTDKQFVPGAILCAYVRDSGGEEQDMSTLQQEDKIRSWCQDKGYILSHIFRDAARPGSRVVDRSGFQDMIHYFRSGAPEAGLVIWSYSRFARDIDDSQFFRADLRRRGYQFYSLSDEIPEGPMGRLFEAVIDWKNEQFLEDMSRDVKRGLRDMVERYGAVPGTPPVGFRRERIEIGMRRNGQARVGHRWVIDEALAAKVRQAFDLRAAGMPVAQIHAELGLYRSLNSYTTFFRNDLYIGKLRFGDLVVENYCQPVVDQQTWQAVQALVREHAAHYSNHGRNHPRRVGSSYLLSGLAHCARCGAPLYGKSSSKQRGAVYDRYDCTSAKRRRDCDFQPVPRMALENAVIRQLREYVLTPAVQQAHRIELERTQETRSGQLEAKRNEQKADLGAVRRKIGHITDAIANAGSSRSLLDKLAALEAEETELLRRITEIERDLRTPVSAISDADMKALIEQLQKVLDQGEIAEIQPLLRGFVDRIVVDRDGETIHGMIQYFYPPGGT